MSNLDSTILASSIGADVLNTPAPRNSTFFAEKVAEQYFGVTVKANLLVCERDQIFKLKYTADTEYLLRFINTAENPLVSNLQTELMLHIARVDPGLQIPRVIKSVDNKAEVLVEMESGESSLVRMISFLPGKTLSNRFHISDELIRSIAHNIARFDLALQGFGHPAAGHKIQWDLMHASDLSKLLGDIDDTEGRVLVEKSLDKFKCFTLPILQKLRSQVIHNDLNYSNVLVDEADSNRITGIIDFGDVVYAPLINEVGIAATYLLDDSENPLAPAVQFVSAYHEVIALEQAELEILYDLIVTRLVMGIVLAERRAKRYPQNREYILRHTSAAWRSLKRLSQISRGDGQSAFLRACT